MTAEELAHKMCLPRQYAGYEQLLLAMELASQDKRRLHHVYREIYGAVAAEFQTSERNVEKNIRSILTAAWKKRPPVVEMYETISGYHSEKRPSSSEFLANVSDYLSRGQEEPQTL